MPAGLLEAIGGTAPVYAFQVVEDALFPREASRSELRRRSCFGARSSCVSDNPRGREFSCRLLQRQSRWRSPKDRE